jgi:bleomycin hydrolase
VKAQLTTLLKRYGIVPQTLYPDSYNAKSSGAMDTLLTTKLRQDGLELRKLKAKGASASSITASKEAMLQDVIRIVTLCLGPPPAADEKFSWEFYDRNNKLKTVSLTPLEFAESAEVGKFVSLVNDPRNDYMRLLTVSNLGNVWDGHPVSYINVDTIVLKEACVAMLRKGLPIFFGSDVGKQLDSSKGIMDTDLIDYELGFNVKLGMTKAERLLTGESQMTHAMVLTAVHLDKDNMPVRWRIENSWSEAAGVGGYFVMSDKWMDEFCYQAVIDKSVLGKAVRDVMKQDPKVLPLWDPMGALA